MNKNKYSLLLFIFWFFDFTSCSKKEIPLSERPRVAEKIILEKLQRLDSKFETIKDTSSTVNCSLYVSGCLKVFRALILGYEVFVVEMQNEELSQLEAKRNQGIYFGNWFIDNIKNETPLIKKLNEELHPQN
jgi:hypothetical protein